MTSATTNGPSRYGNTLMVLNHPNITLSIHARIKNLQDSIQLRKMRPLKLKNSRPLATGCALTFWNLVRTCTEIGAPMIATLHSNQVFIRVPPALSTSMAVYRVDMTAVSGTILLSNNF